MFRLRTYVCLKGTPCDNKYTLLPRHVLLTWADDARIRLFYRLGSITSEQIVLCEVSDIWCIDFVQSFRVIFRNQIYTSQMGIVFVNT